MKASDFPVAWVQTANYYGVRELRRDRKAMGLKPGLWINDDPIRDYVYRPVGRWGFFVFKLKHFLMDLRPLFKMDTLLVIGAVILVSIGLGIFALEPNFKTVFVASILVNVGIAILAWDAA